MARSLFTGMIISLLFCACKHDALPVSEGCNIPDTVSFRNDVMQLFNAHCNTAGCHTGSQPQGGLNLDSLHAYAALTRQGSGYVDTVNPLRSLLYAQMTSASTPMPPTGNLPKCSTDLIIKWMMQGARDN